MYFFIRHILNSFLSANNALLLVLHISLLFCFVFCVSVRFRSGLLWFQGTCFKNGKLYYMSIV